MRLVCSGLPWKTRRSVYNAKIMHASSRYLASVLVAGSVCDPYLFSLRIIMQPHKSWCRVLRAFALMQPGTRFGPQSSYAPAHRRAQKCEARATSDDVARRLRRRRNRRAKTTNGTTRRALEVFLLCVCECTFFCVQLQRSFMNVGT